MMKNLINNAIARGIEKLLAAERESALFQSFVGGPQPKSASRKSLPSREELGGILTNEKEALCYLEEKNVIQYLRNCPYCDGKLQPMSRDLRSKSRFVLRWRRRSCSKYSKSVLSGSILAKCCYQKHIFMDLLYHWLLGCNNTQITKALGMSNRTITDWTNYLRECVTADILYNSDSMIGGPGIIVEIDESKFGKRKYHVCILQYNECSAMSIFSLRMSFSAAW